MTLKLIPALNLLHNELKKQYKGEQHLFKCQVQKYQTHHIFCFQSQSWHVVHYRGGNPRCGPPRPLNPPRSPRKFGRFLSRPRSPRPEGPPRPPRCAPPPLSAIDLGVGDLGRSLSISSVQPDK